VALGLLGRKYALTCDHLVGARVVLEDGRIVDCDAKGEPDLFWALRGAGGGQLKFKTRDLQRIHGLAEQVTRDQGCLLLRTVPRTP
jgi:hypothetical protein